MSDFKREYWIPLGILLGLPIGVSQGNPGVGIALGLCFGVALYAAAGEKDDEEESD